MDQGGDLLSEAGEGEEDILDKAFDVRMNSRLGCQAKLEGDGLVVLRISKESLDAYYNISKPLFAKMDTTARISSNVITL